MMSDSRLRNISLLIALAGIAIIAVVAFLVKPGITQIGAITDGDVGERIIINGTIADYGTSDGNVFIDVKDETGAIEVVMFERTARGRDVYSLSNNDAVIVEGQINIYKGRLEVIADSIVRG